MTADGEIQTSPREGPKGHRWPKLAVRALLFASLFVAWGLVRKEKFEK